jgi:TolA-binding protein
MIKFFLLPMILCLLTSCIKTAEQLQREKKIDSISNQFGDTQGLVADLVFQVKSIQSQLDKMNGRLEEIEHKQNQVSTDQLTKTNENFNLLKNQQDSDRDLLAQIQNDLKEQRSFIEKVTNSLSSLKDVPSKGLKKKDERDELNYSLSLIKNHKYEDARKLLESLIESQNLSPGDKNKVLHGLGKVEYFSGNHEKAMVYFSKIFTKFPKATLAPSSLLFIGRSLNKMGKTDEARQAFEKVIEDYKGTKEANEAKKEI